ncbi:T-complex 11 [Zopfochytrium polystomum]|nr:T-complex 11 [Zopfochytrium polystomum]
MSDSPSPLPIINTELNGPVNSDETDLSAALRSGEFILKDIASSFGLPFSKEQLAHELVLDPEFSLKKPEIPKFEKAVRDSVRKLYFDSVRESFEKEDFSLYIPELVNEIRQKLMAMLPENSSIITELNDRLNPEDIYRSLAARALDVKELLAYIISKMSLLCAPIRDGSIRGISASLEEVPSSPGFVAIVESILELLDDMRLDLANFRLFSLRPVLKNIAAEYERARFASALENGTVHLDRTREWLVRSVTQYGDQGGLAGEGRENRFIAVFHSAITGLVFEWSPPHHDKASKSLSVLPETMAMDVERIDRFRNEGQKLCIVAVLVMLSLNVVPELRGDHAFAVRLKESLVTLLRDTDGLSIENISAELCRQMSVSLERKKRKLEESKQHLVKRMVQKTVAADDPVFDLVRRRIMSVVVAHLATGRFPHDAVERAGLAAVRMELENLSTAVCLWARFNGEVYSRYYDDELREILPVTRVGNSNFAN